MPNSFLAVPVALHLIAASSGAVPAFDVVPSCRAATIAQVTSGDTTAACLKDEQRAHDQLAKTWTKFTFADRAPCLRATTNFDPSYTELLTCLEMASEAKKLPQDLY